MKKTVLIILLLILSFSFMLTAQNRQRKELKGIINKDIIINACGINDKSNAAYNDYHNLGEMVIDTDSIYQIWFGTCQSPAIDFKEYSILGMKASPERCATNIITIRKVAINKHRKKYRYTVAYRLKGHRCKGRQYAGWYWVAVPKIPDGYSVEYPYKVH